jgi:hypothetical protein
MVFNIAECAMERFRKNVPPKPYCAHNKSGKIILKREDALKFRYLQVNTPKGLYYIVFDCDFDGGWLAHELSDLPAPTFAVVNEENGHAHNFYELDYRYYAEKPSVPSKPLFKNVIGYYREALKADAVITTQRLVVKNPLRADAWRVWIPGRVYTLTELAEYIPADWSKHHFSILNHSIMNLEDVLVPDSRNCTLFEFVRRWSYSIIGGVHSASDLEDAVRGLLQNARGNLKEHFPEKGNIEEKDIRSLEKSIACWVWKHRDRIRRKAEKNEGVMNFPRMRGLTFKEYLKETRRRQGEGGRYSAALRSKETVLKIQGALESLHRLGRPFTQRELAATAGISERTLRKYRHLLSSRF